MNKSQETIIILHGWVSSKEKWQAVKEKLQSENHSRTIRVVVPDLPGFKEETSLEKVWNLDDYVQWFENFCSDFPEPFYLLGHSFGGRIAIKFAARYPEKLKGLILVSSAGIIPENSDYEKLLSKLAKKGKKFSFLPFYPFLRKIFYRYILRKTDYIKAEKLPHLKETFKEIIREDLREYFPQIKTKTLIIWGDRDDMTPLSDAYLMNKEIKDSKLEILKAVGHFPYRESPEILTQKIINFIQNV